MISEQDRNLIAVQKGAGQTPSIFIAVLEPEQSGEYKLSHPVIACLNEGAALIRFVDGAAVRLTRTHLFILAAGKFSLTVEIRAQMTLCLIARKSSELLREIYKDMPWMDEFPEDAQLRYASIRINKPLKYFFAGISMYLETGMENETLSEAKMTELVQIIVHSQNREEYKRFFSLLISREAAFEMFAHRHAASISTVAQLAEMANISVRTLNSRFRECMGISPKEFLECERTKRIAKMLLDGQLSLKMVAYEEGISVQYLNRICRKEFDMPPAQIRAKCADSTQKVALFAEKGK